MKRYCILTLPRSGSQLCEILLENNNPNSYRLGEMFEGWCPSNYILENGKIHQTPKDMTNVPIKLIDTISSDWKYKLDLIKQAGNLNDYTLRIFIFNHRNFYIQKQIMNHLKDYGFRLISLKRNFEEVFLSNIIAKQHKLNGKDIYVINSKIPKDPIKISIDAHFFHSMLNYLFISSLFWYTKLNQLLGNVNYEIINYETIYTDCQRILGHKIEKINLKTLELNPYDYIVNADEVKSLLEPYIKIFDKIGNNLVNK